MNAHDKSIREIEELGYTTIRGGVPEEIADSILSRIKTISSLHAENSSNMKTPYLNRGHDLIYNIQNKDYYILNYFINHIDIKKVLMHFLNDSWYKSIPADKPNYILRSMAARSSGKSNMPLHIDSFIPSSGKTCWSIQVALILEDQTLDNGCTVVVPGSHLFDSYASQEYYEQAIPILSKKGDIVMWDSRLWHGAYGNKSELSRWSLIATFGRWWLKQNYDITAALPKNFLNQLNNEEKTILGFFSIPPYDEYERIDIKTGYDGT